MDHIQPEIDRIRQSILDGLNTTNTVPPALYAAQQALEWARSPASVKSPYDMLTADGGSSF